MTTIGAYRVPPLREYKARREIRKARERAYLPTERHGKRKAPVARGYIFATGKPLEAEHVRGKIGDVPRAQLIRLYPRRDAGHVPLDPFQPGDRVLIERGPFASLIGTVVEKCKRGWLVDVALFSRVSRVSMKGTNMRKHDPG